MSDKKLARQPLAELLNRTRTYFNTDPDETDTFHRNHVRIVELAVDLCGDYLTGVHLLDLVFGVYHLKKGATFEDLESVLALLGWEVVDDEPAEC